MIQAGPSTLSPLPAAPAAPLHVLPPASLPLLLAAAAVLLLALVWWIVRILRRRRGESTASPPPVPSPATAAAPAIGVGARIQAIEGKFLASKAFREGCHALAEVIKSHLAHTTGLAAERMTSQEIASAVDDRRIGGFMTRLSLRRYGRDEPRRKHFVAACDQARELLA